MAGRSYHNHCPMWVAVRTGPHHILPALVWNLATMFGGGSFPWLRLDEVIALFSAPGVQPADCGAWTCPQTGGGSARTTGG